ncbi:MAG: hypothetical protein PHD81_02005 [Candidatus Nanoarchaeia archaeon]|nr:hypothetical protein [Candidatus Nanoarchaeia archaeon]MDD5587863.1 hypothetical protein [Candidatus Nanoarchaeia archaeon]
MLNLNKKELKILKKLDTPKKIQDFLNKIEINFEEQGETCMSPRMVLKTKKAHCIEGAILAALALRLQGEKPLLVDLKTTKEDYEHVLAVFQKHGKWGAITKTNHAVLRYREPVYRDIKELVMSYFHEYFMDNGKKTLRSFSNPVDLSVFDDKNWATDKEDLWYIHDYLDSVKHYSILDKKQEANLRKADKIEIKAGKLVEFRKD